MGKKKTSESKKKRFQEYKSNNLKDQHKASKFERRVRQLIKQAEKGKIRDTKPEYENGKVNWIKTLTNKWTFGPFGKIENKKFVEIIPNWMKPIIEKYQSYYKKEHTPKKVSTYIKGDSNQVEVIEEKTSLHKQAMKFKKRGGIRPSQQK
jgi:hypothetical protein